MNIVLILDFEVYCRVFCQNQTSFPVFRLTLLLEGQQSRTLYDDEEEEKREMATRKILQL